MVEVQDPLSKTLNPHKKSSSPLKTGKVDPLNVGISNNIFSNHSAVRAPLAPQSKVTRLLSQNRK